MRTGSISSKPSRSFFPFDREQLSAIAAIAIPVTLQTILFASKGLTDMLMIGQLSEHDIAAAGVASRALFVAMILLSGISAAGSVLIAQYFGANKHHAIRRTVVLSWFISTLFALFPALLFLFAGDKVIALSTSSLPLQTLGHEYLSYTAASLLFASFSGAIAAGLRSTRQASVSTWLSGLGIVLNLVLNWLLIFGHFGLPALGLKGAAIATTISCLLEVLITIAYLRIKQHALAPTYRAIQQAFNLKHIRDFLTLAIPTTTNFLLWAAGLFTYTAIMGQTGDQGLVVLSVISPIEAFSLSFLTGIANASAVIVGNHLGSKDADKAYQQAMGFVVLAIIVTLLVALILFLLREPVLSLFGALDGDTRQLANQFYLILCFGIVLRSLPTTMVVGVLRAGGDVKFCLYQDISTQWLFGIPLAALGAMFFGLSPSWVFASFFLETLFKWGACIYRFKSKRWIKFLAS
ncbi:MATE family efflux transporter [Vibrio aquaticus]|uniref:Multidrug resistance protein NorM n=1 Tax=Vibrio aquaticus TaxID=2496559 RepID=A0A3S0V4R9_9VIBR|nr:MATE family efflux transporter [Vibrio aquaticus]RTZ17827.1 MATE family efflux transporter [Vibrio aquaticus]